MKLDILVTRYFFCPVYFRIIHLVYQILQWTYLSKRLIASEFRLLLNLWYAQDFIGPVFPVLFALRMVNNLEGLLLCCKLNAQVESADAWVLLHLRQKGDFACVYCLLKSLWLVNRGTIFCVNRFLVQWLYQTDVILDAFLRLLHFERALVIKTGLRAMHRRIDSHGH